MKNYAAIIALSFALAACLGGGGGGGGSDGDDETTPTPPASDSQTQSVPGTNVPGSVSVVPPSAD